MGMAKNILEFLKHPIKGVCEILGEANEPVYTVVAVAAFKGLFRPIFTMMDKHQDPETKKYAAIREGSTELIAIPTYLTLSWAVQQFAPAFAVDKTIGRTLEHSQRTLGFLGVCFAALYAIPKLCNVAMPHVMKALKMDKPQKNEAPLASTTPIFDGSAKNGNLLSNVQSPYSKTQINTGGGLRI